MAATIKSIAATVAVASLQMLVFTAIFAGLAVIGAGIGKLIDYFRGLTPEIKESRARMKELAEQANETAKQIRLMLAPGKQQEGQAFDAIVKAAKAASDEIDNYNRILERKNIIEKENIQVLTGYIGSKPTAQAGASQKQFNTREEAETFAGPSGRVSENLISIETAYKNLENSAIKQLGITKEEAKLLIGNYKVILSTLDAKDEASVLEETDLKNIAARVKAVGSITASFAEMQESGKNLSKFTKDLFPKKTVSAATEVANSFKEILVNIEAGPKEGQDLALFAKGLANEIATMGPSIRDNITALEAQGISFEKQAGTLSKIKALEEARRALAAAELKNNPQLVITALGQLAAAQDALAADQEGVVALLTKFEVEQRILGVLSEINQEKIKQKNLESQIAKQSGDNAKSAAEYAQTIKDSKRLEAGLDLNIPEELTLDYRIKIAQIEQSTAETIARIKKETLRLEAQNQQIQIQSEIGRLQKELGNKGRLTGLSDQSLENLSKNPNADRDQALLELQIRAQEGLLSLGKELLEINIAGADSETLRAKGTLKTLEAQKKGLNPVKLAAQYALQELDALKEKQDILNANADALSMGAQLSTQVTSLLRASEIPALQQKLTIAEQNRAEQKAFNDENKNLSAEDLAFNERKLRILTEVESAAREQLNVVNQIVDSATAGLIAESASLDLQDKKLNILRDQANAMKSLKDAQLNLTRAQAEASAKKQGRELSASEQGALKANELKSQIEGIVGLPSNPSKEQSMSEMALLEKEKNLLIEKSKLEEALFTIRFAAAEQELANSIALAKTQNLDTTKSQAALDKMRSLSLDFASIFADERSAITANKEAEKQTLQARADALMAELSATATTPEQVGNQILLELGNQLRSVFGGFGLTGQGADFYNSEAPGIMNNTKLSPDERKEELKNLKAISFEIQQQQILTEGLNGIFDNLSSGIEGAFMAMIDGSKSAKQAFGEMAIAILKDIAAMTIRMLIFKAIQSGLNFLSPPTPMAAKVGYGYTDMRGVYANGGIIALANGGIMDARGGLQGIVSKPTYLVGEGRYNEAVVPLPNGKSIPVQMHGGSSQSNNVAVTVNMTNNGSQTQTEGQDPAKLGQAIAAAVQRELVAQKAPGGLLNRYSAI
jgi:hypothetical protein